MVEDYDTLIEIFYTSSYVDTSLTDSDVAEIYAKFLQITAVPDAILQKEENL